jgi:hypothetical protein
LGIATRHENGHHGIALPDGGSRFFSAQAARNREIEDDGNDIVVARGRAYEEVNGFLPVARR